jgi:hypothetical protein
MTITIVIIITIINMNTIIIFKYFSKCNSLLPVFLFYSYFLSHYTPSKIFFPIFIFRILLLLLSEKDDKISKRSFNIIKARNILLEGIMAINCSLPKNAGEIYSNFGENWLDFKSSIEGCCVSSRQCVLSGENKIQFLDAACRLQKLLSLFNSLFMESKNTNLNIDDNYSNNNNSNNNNSNNNNSNINNSNINNSNNSINSNDSNHEKNCDSDKNENNEDKNKNNTVFSSRNLRSRVLILAGSCARVIPLTAITVRTCLFFGALNQRYVYVCVVV